MFDSKKRSGHGFTLSEILLVVGIIAILVAIAIPSVIYIRKNLHMTKLDITARQIFVAAQNRMTSLWTSGAMQLVRDTDHEGDLPVAGLKRLPEKPEDFDSAGISWVAEDYVCAAHNLPGLGTGDADVLLPEFSIDETVRGEGYYVIEYNQKTGQIYGVFFSEESFGYDAECFEPGVRTDRTVRRDDMASSPVGYYGGSGSEMPEIPASDNPDIYVVNKDTLELRVVYASDGTDYEVTIKNAEPGSSETATLSFSSAGVWGKTRTNPLTINNFILFIENGEIAVILDGLNPGEQFKTVLGGAVTPGAELVIEVVSKERGSVESDSVEIGVNSLFASLSGGAAQIAWARHLQNLDPDYSGISKATGDGRVAVTEARQVSIPANKDDDQVQNSNAERGGNIVWSAVGWVGAPQAFMPIDNPLLTRYDGDELEIKDLDIGGPVDAGGSNYSCAGMFAVLYPGATAENIRLVNPVYHGTSVFADYAGMLAGRAESVVTITNCRVTAPENNEGDHVVTGFIYAGGLVGLTDNCSIELCTVTGISIEGGQYAGGVTGLLSGELLKTGVTHSTVTLGSGSYAGGIAGYNLGTIEDVFFLSTAEWGASPVSDEGGGIIGYNDGSLTRALYLAPSPQTVGPGTDNDGNPISVTTIYPIVRDGNPGETVTSGTKTYETCFYLAGNNRSLKNGRDGTWDDFNYNTLSALASGKVELTTGGKGLNTPFIEIGTLTGIERNNLANWEQLAFQGSGVYPYPVPAGLPEPKSWPEAVTKDPMQQQRFDWEASANESDRLKSLDFVNGDFGDPYKEPANNLRTVDGEYGIDDPNGNYGGIWFDNDVHLYMRGINGWNTRPTTPSELEDYQKTDGWMYAIELVRTRYGNENDGFMPVNYRGSYGSENLRSNAGANTYAELNAGIPGTLYQTCETRPQQDFYYSFYHASRAKANTYAVDMMNFFLSPVTDLTNLNPTGTPMALDEELMLIRPCWSPRRAQLSSLYNSSSQVNTGIGKGSRSLYFNTVVCAPVNYGQVSGLRDYWSDMYPDMPEAPYVFDVWIGDRTYSEADTASSSSVTAISQITMGADSYGITFWADQDYALGNHYATLADLIAAIPEADTNVIGYWDISYGWKHYYGIYTVPQGQGLTEFAWQSTNESDKLAAGNLLDGASFQMASFLTVTEKILHNGEETATVNPGETITIEMTVKAHGDVPANKIVLSNKLHTYDAYYDFVPNSATSTLANCTIELRGSPGQKNLELVVEPEEDYELHQGDSFTVTFQLQIRDEIRGMSFSTLFYFIENQATAKYNSGGVIDAERENSSLIHRISVADIQLEKKITHIDGIGLADGAAALGGYGTDFTVELKIINASGLETTGIVSDTLPRGFEFVSSSTYVTVMRVGANQRIFVDFDYTSGGNQEYTLTYTMRYMGNEFGVTTASMESDYKFTFESVTTHSNQVVLRFMEPLLGIRARALDDDEFPEVTVNKAATLDFTKKASVHSTLPDAGIAASLDIKFYTDQVGGTEITPTTVDGYKVYTSPGNYTATLIWDADRYRISFTALAEGERTLYYRIVSMSTDNVYDLSSGIAAIKISAVPAASGGNTSISEFAAGDETGDPPVPDEDAAEPPEEDAVPGSEPSENGGGEGDEEPSENALSEADGEPSENALSEADGEPPENGGESGDADT